MPDTTSSFHPPPDALRRFALGQLAATEAQSLEHHIEHCPACCARLAACVEEPDSLAMRLQQAGSPTPPADTDDNGSATIHGGSSSHVAETEPTPSLLGRYAILGELGRGGMGVVYKARDVQLRRFVAIKMIRNGTFDDADNLARFHAEGLAVARLRHPHIVQLLEVGEEKGTPYQVLEFLDGGSLADHCAHQPQDFAYAARLVQTLAEAVEHAHAQGVIHRDLKPANVLLTGDGVAKVTDFGLVKFNRQQLAESLSLKETTTGNIVGTPLYMSPEQARGVPGTIGPSTDIYALGVILYELLTGSPPFAGLDSPLDVLQALQVREPPSPRSKRADLPPDLEVICLKCLRLEPQHRYVTAGELAAELGRFLRGEPIQARPLSWREKTERWCRRNPLTAGLLGGLGAVIIASLIGLTFLYLDADTQRERAEQNERTAQAQTREAEQQRKEAQKEKAEADRQRKDAQTQKAEADKQREDALAFLDIARRAVETFHTRVMTDPKLKENDFRAFRLALLASTVQFHEALIQRRSDDPTLQALQGRAFRQLGDIRTELGETNAALKAYGQAHDLLRSLRTRYPNMAVLSNELVGTLHNRAMLLAQLGRFPDAFTDFRELLAVQDQLATAEPKNLLRRRNLIVFRSNYARLLQQTGRASEAITIWTLNLPLLEEVAVADPRPENRAAVAGLKNNLAALHLASGQPALALPLLQSARKDLERLLAEVPGDGRVRLIHVQTCSNLGDALNRLGQPTPALEIYQEGLDQGRKLVRQHPTVMAYREALGGVACNTGVLLTKLSQPEEALSSFDEAVRELELVRKTAPRLVTARSYLCNAFIGRAELLGTLNRHADALRDWDQALPLESSANQPWTVLRRARTLMFLDRVAEGVMASEKALPADAGPDLRFFAAAVWSLAAERFPKSSPEAERSLAQSVKLLERLAAEGHLNRTDLAQSLHTLPDFAPLRRHPAYARLLPTPASPP